MEKKVPTITGHKGASSRTPVEAANTLRSIAVARVLDLISEGEIVGLVDGLKSVYLNETPVQNADDTLNFQEVKVEFRYGTQTQDIIPGFPAAEAETSVGVELKDDISVVRSISNIDVDAVRVRLSVLGLSESDSKTGDTSGYKVDYAVDVATDGGPFVETLLSSFDGKTMTKYERSHRINLPPSTTGWQIRVRRTTPNAESATIQDTTYVEAITEVIDAKLRYPNSALVGITMDASQFQTIPSRAYHMRGRLVRVPSNYDPETRVYTGIWDGTYKIAYSNNPAWAFLDLVTHERYGLGNRITDAMIDKWELYKIAQYCDEMVEDGFGGLEPRFTCNLYLQSQDEAYRVLQNLSTVFRGITYWSGGKIVPISDMPDDPVYTYTPANVVDGVFTYQGSAGRTRHTVALVSWNDLNDFGRAKVEYVDDQDGIARFGIQQTDMTAIGCTSQGQAQRLGRYALMTAQYETDTITFTVGPDATRVAPGKIIRIADPLRAGKRMGGRISAATTSVVTVDADVVAAVGDELTVIDTNGEATTRTISSVSGRDLTVNPTFTTAPIEQSVWAIDQAALKTQRARVISITEDDDGINYTIVALRHEYGKFATIDTGTKIDLNPTLGTPGRVEPVKPPTDIAVVFRDVVVHSVLRKAATVSWVESADAVGYEVKWRQNNGNWNTINTARTASAEIPSLAPGNVEVMVRAVNAADMWSLSTYSGAISVLDPNRPHRLDFFEVSDVNGVRTFSFGYGSNPPLGYVGTEIRYVAQPVAENEGDPIPPPVAVPLWDDAFPGAFEAFWETMTPVVPGYLLTSVQMEAPAKGTWVIIGRPRNSGGRLGQPSQVTVELGEPLSGVMTGVIEGIDGEGGINERIDGIIADIEGVEGVGGINERIDGIVEDIEGVGGINERISGIVTDIEGPGGLVEQINTEISNRINQGNEIGLRIDGVVLDVETITDGLEKEILDRTNGDQNLQDDITQEAIDRTTAINTAVGNAKSELQAEISVVRAQVADVFGADEYDPAKTYPIEDLVVYGGKLYRALAEVPINTPPGTNPAYWELLGNYKSLGDAVAGNLVLSTQNANEIEAISTTITAHTAKFEDVDADILSLQQTTADGDGALAQDITTINVRLDDSSTGLIANANAITALTAEVETIDGTVTAHTQQLTALEAQVGPEVLGDEKVPHPTFNGGYTTTGGKQLPTGWVWYGEANISASTVSPDSYKFTATAHLAGINLPGGAGGPMYQVIGKTLRYKIRARKTAQVSASSLEYYLGNGWKNIVPTGAALNQWYEIEQDWSPTQDTFILSSFNGHASWEVSLVSIREVTTLNLAEAINSLTVTVQQNADGVALNAADITVLDLTLNDPVTGLAATSSALDLLDATVTQQGQDITSIAGRTTSLETTVNDPISGVVATSNALSTLTSEVSVIDGKVTSQGSAITALENQIADPATGLQASADAIDALTTTVTQQGQDITSVANRTTALETTVNDPVTGVSANSSGLSALTTRVTTAEGNINATASDVTSLETTVNDPTTGVSATASGLSALTTRVTASEGEIDSITADVTTLENAVNDPSTGLSATANGLSALTTRVTAAEGTISSHSSDITALENTVNDPVTGVDVTASALQTLDSRVGVTPSGYVSFAAAITALNSEVDGKASASALSSLDTRVGDLTGTGYTSVASAITALESQVDDKASASALQALITDVGEFPTGSFTSAAQAVTSLNTTVAGKAESSVVTALDSRVGATPSGYNSFSAAYTALNNSLADKASASALQTLSNTVGDVVGAGYTSVSSALTALNNEVDGKASSTALSTLDSRVGATPTGYVSFSAAITALDNEIDGKASASALQTLDSRVGETPSGYTTFAAAITALNTEVDGKAESSALSTLDTKVGATPSGYTSFSSAFTALKSEVDGKGSASTLDYLYTYVGPTTIGTYTTLAGAVTSINTTVGDHTTTISQHTSSIDGISGKAGVSIDVNGRVVGWELNNGLSSGAMVISVDTLSIVSPSGTGARSEFTNQAWKVYGASGNLKIFLGIR